MEVEGLEAAKISSTLQFLQHLNILCRQRYLFTLSPFSLTLTLKKGSFIPSGPGILKFLAIERIELSSFA